MANILITGGAGFIGSNLAIKLAERGHNITVLDNLSKQVHGENPEKTSPLFRSIFGKVLFLHGSVTSKKDLEAAVLCNQDIIVHLAAETGTGQSMYQIDHYTQVNIQGTANLLDILTNSKHSISKVIVASSRAIYGEGQYLCNSGDKHIVYPQSRKIEDLQKGDFEVKYPDYKIKLMPTNENANLQPTSIYGITKQVQEQLVMLCTQSIGIAGVSLRYQNVYGPGQSLSNPYTGILSIFSTRIKNNNEINIFEDGTESRDFIYIDDVVDATILAIEKDEANNQIFNVGSGVSTSVKQIADLLIKKFNSNTIAKITGNYRLGDVRHNYADISKISSILGFKPKIDIETGISLFVDWVNTQKIAEDNYDKTINQMKKLNLFK
jgi:dTDP-L-rhamnose 4-epimerase